MDTVIHTLDEMPFRPPAEKAKAETVPGRFGGAVRFSFEEEAKGAFFHSGIRGTPEWDRADGFSFWVQGDGSDNLGGIQFIYDEDYAVRYDYAFPLKNREWTKVNVAWRDLVPVLPGPRAVLLDPTRGNKPSKLSGFWVGKWWYWRDYPAHSFTLDELRLEPKLTVDRKDYKPSGPPLGRVRAKLKAGKPITIVTMGDSLTDTRHWANREVIWHGLLQQKAREKFRSEVTIVNPAIGGTQLRQNLVLLPKWTTKTPAPDLVTVGFGFNDWEAGMRGPQFYEAYVDAIDRIRRATKGKSDVLILTTLPSVEKWTTMAELAEACRKAAKNRNAGVADTEKAFHTEGASDHAKPFAWDKVHLSPVGHEIVARTVLEAIG